MEKVNNLFGDKAFCKYVKTGNKWDWTKPQKMIFDPMMIAIDSVEIDVKNTSVDKNIEVLKKIYKENENIAVFNGKKQSKMDIEERAQIFIDVIHKIK